MNLDLTGEIHEAKDTENNELFQDEEKQPIISPENSLAVVKALCAILESSRFGGSVVTVGG